MSFSKPLRLSLRHYIFSLLSLCRGNKEGRILCYLPKGKTKVLTFIEKVKKLDTLREREIRLRIMKSS